MHSNALQRASGLGGDGRPAPSGWSGGIFCIPVGFGGVQGYNAQIVVTPDQIILAAEVTTDANDVHQLTSMLDHAQANVEAVIGEDAVLGAAVADAGCWSKANAASETEECELFIATIKDHKQQADLRTAPPPRSRTPKGLSARARMERKLPLLIFTEN